MSLSTPATFGQSFSEHSANKDLDRLLQLYEGDAVLITPQNEEFKGTEAIRKNLQTYLERKPKFQGEVVSVTQSGDLALVHTKWSFQGTRPNNETVKLSSTSADVLRKQPDGTWKVVINRPGGAG